MTDEREKLKPRGCRFTDAQWSHLERKAGKNSTPSDYNRKLVDDDIARDKGTKWTVKK